MKHTKIVVSVVGLVLSAVLVVGCKKVVDNTINKSNIKKTITANSVISKVVDNYKAKELTDVKMTTKTTLVVDNNNKVDLAAVFHNYFVDKDMKKCITNLNLKLTVDKTTNHINMFMNEQGNIVYALNNKNFYSADEMYTMLGIKYTAPKLETKEVKSTPDASLEPTEDIYKIDGTLEPSDDDIDDLIDEEDDEVSATPTPRKTYTLDHLNNLASKLIIKGNKEIDGKDCYVLKGQIQSIEIRNFLVTYLETNLYSIPKEFGDISYEIYVDKESYEICGMTWNVDDLIRVLSENKDVEGNDIDVAIEYNTGSVIKFPTPKETSVDCYSNILAAVESISNSLKKMKK